MGPGSRVDYLAGAWAREFTPYQVLLPAGELSFGSRTGTTSFSCSPTIRVAGLESDAGVGSPTYGISLAWSGSWRMLVDAPPFRDRVRVAGGTDDESGVITLEPGESFGPPAMLGVLAADGPGVMHRWHRYQRDVLARSTGLEHRPIVYNSWYATGFDVRLDHQAALAQRAADLGVEVFVVDDGWFVGRDDDRGGLGDWRPDPHEFPAGLGPLVDTVVERGMRFGIWVEPEAVSPGSELYRDHPDWVYRAGERPLVQQRHQYVLDFGRAEVVAWTKDWLRTLLADRRISYLKWDMNRPISDGGRPGDLHGRQWATQHVEGFYAVLLMLREEFPHVTVEGCSAGGGRIDAGGLELVDVVWPSDETGPRDRLAIQHGFLSAWSPHLMSSWVTDELDRLDLEPASLEFRFVVAMAGVLGIGADLLAWDDDRNRRAADLIALYRRIRTTVHTGRVDLHGTPRDPVYAIEYGTPDQTVLLVWGRGDRARSVRLQPNGVERGRRYRISAGLGPSVEKTLDETGVEVPFSLAPDTDVMVLEPVR